jgi:hypothetical protein
MTTQPPIRRLRRQTTPHRPRRYARRSLLHRTPPPSPPARQTRALHRASIAEQYALAEPETPLHWRTHGVMSSRLSTHRVMSYAPFDR